MYKLILHIGYPKTATTSLQEGCFYKLHEKGVINYLGRTLKSTHTSSLKSQFDGTDWAVEIRRNFLFGTKFSSKKIILRSDVVNVLSDEELTTHPYYHEAQFGVNKDPFSIVNILKDLIPDHTEIIVLMTIRNQAHLIKSFYTQKYRFVHVKDSQITLNDFVFKLSGELSDSIVKTYDFNQIASHYQDTLNAKVCVLFFEDLKNDPVSFFSVLGSLIHVPADDLITLVNHVHYRNRKNNNPDLLKAQIPVFFGSLLERFFGKDAFRFYWAKKKYMRNSAYFRLYSKFFVKKVEIPRPDLSNYNDAAVISFFSGPNKIFAENFGCSLEKMERYGYIVK